MVPFYTAEDFMGRTRCHIREPAPDVPRPDEQAAAPSSDRVSPATTPGTHRPPRAAGPPTRRPAGITVTSPHHDQPARADRRTLPYPRDEAITAARPTAAPESTERAYVVWVGSLLWTGTGGVGAGSGFDGEVFDEVVAQREPIAEIDGAAGEVAFEVVCRDVVGGIGLLGVREADGVGEFSG